MSKSLLRTLSFAVLIALCLQSAARAQWPPPAAPPPPRHAHGFVVAGAVLLGFGVVLSAIGVALVIDASGTDCPAGDGTDFGLGHFQCTQGRDVRMGGGVVSLVLGGISLATGSPLLAVGVARSRPARPQFSFAPRSGGGVLTLAMPW